MRLFIWRNLYIRKSHNAPWYGHKNQQFLDTHKKETHLQVRPLDGFLRAMAQTTQSRAVKNLKLIFNVFIQEIPKNTIAGAHGEN